MKEVKFTIWADHIISTMVIINCRMGMGVGHREPSQTAGCLNFINIQTTAGTTRTT